MVDYSAVKSLSHVVVPSSLTVVGLGGLGLWGAYQAVMLGVEKVSLYDGEPVTDIDLTKVPYEPSHVGLNKAQSAAELLRRLRPACELFVYDRHFDPKDCASIVGSVLNAADDISVDQYLSEHCKENSVPYVSACYGQNAVVVLDRMPRNLKVSETAIPTTSSLCSAAAGLAVHSLFSKKPYSLLIDFDRGPNTIPDIDEALSAMNDLAK